MSLQRYKVCGGLLLLMSFAMPLPIRSVPVVTLQADSVNADTIFCEGCNPLVFGQPLNINEASIEHLMSLPHIGEKRATDIMTHRLNHGDFKKLQDLDQVRGIGPKTLSKIQPYIVME